MENTPYVTPEGVIKLKATATTLKHKAWTLEIPSINLKSTSPYRKGLFINDYTFFCYIHPTF